MIRTTKRASERRGAEVAMLRTAVHGRGTRQCLERARAANIAARNESRTEKRGALAKWETDAGRMGDLALALAHPHVACPVMAGAVVRDARAQALFVLSFDRQQPIQS